MTAKFRTNGDEIKCVTKWGNKRVDTEKLKEFWANLEEMKTRRGVYVFAVHASKGWKPLYVGRTKKQTFRARIAQHANRTGRFNKILKRIKKGKLWLFFIGRVGKGKRSNSAIDDLEIEFINYAFAGNKNLDNDRGLKKPKYQVKGFGGKGKLSPSEKKLRDVLGYKSSQN
jgi:hypothetical protein